MMRALIKKELLELHRGYFMDMKTGKKRSKKSLVGYLLLLALVFVGVGFAFYSMAGGVGAAVLGNGANWIYFALMGLISVVLGVFGSVFNTYASLYLPKDNEQMLALPIEPWKLLVSRMIGVYVMSLLYSGWLWLPALIAYWVIAAPGAVGYICPILLTFVIALFVSVLTCFFGWLVAMIATKAKGKSYITVIVSLIFIVGYYFVYFRIVGALSDFLSHIDAFSAAIKTWLYPLYLLGLAADGSIAALLLFTVGAVLLFVLCCRLLSGNFLRIASAGSVTRKAQVKENRIVESDMSSALLKRELKHFSSNPTWMLNAGIGLLIMPILAVLAVIKCADIREFLTGMSEGMPELAALIPALLLTAMCMIISMNIVSAPSVSLEGKSIWIVQSLPVAPAEILRAKARMHILLNAGPALVSALVIGIVAQLEIYKLVLVLAAIWLFIALTAYAGLFLNLKNPNLSWTNEAVPVKQSSAVFIALFGGWLFAIVLGVGAYLLRNLLAPEIYLVICMVLIAVLTRVLTAWMSKKGAEIFASL